LNQSPTLKLQGRSGCRLQVISKGGVFFVRKYSKDASYSPRLLAQAQKQSNFISQIKIHGFSTPEVISQSKPSEPETWFDMPYVHGQKYSELFERATVPEIKALSRKFIEYFQHLFNSAKDEPVQVSSFLEKIEAIKVLLKNREDIDQPLAARTLDFLKILPANTLPVHTCHGDFTFSNMLFSAKEIILVDFLDSFIESPLIDFFYWSMIVEGDIPKSRVGKIIQIFRYFDQEIVTAFSENTFVRQWYNYLQVFNLIRILPYVYHPSEIKFVQHGINRIITF
jgi:aminoglycoside phosphotransferase (APT) family kinase protein